MMERRCNGVGQEACVQISLCDEACVQSDERGVARLSPGFIDHNWSAKSRNNVLY